MIEEINNKKIFNFKIITVNKDFEEHIITSIRGDYWTYDGQKIIKSVYFDHEENKRLYIEFDGDSVLRMHRIIGLEII